MIRAHNLVNKLWEIYCQNVPTASKVRKALMDRNEIWIEDHIALRTFNWNNFNKNNIEAFFESLGWQTVESSYVFPEKKLTALHMAHPDRTLPKIFISQLEVEQLSAGGIKIINKYLSNHQESLISCTKLDDAVSYFCMTPWGRISVDDYQYLLLESQYAAWTLLFGNNVNHFTISVHLMKNLNTLHEMNNLVESLGIKLNADHGKIKGSPEVLLEQSSTLADLVEVEFNGGERLKVPYAFIEFANRYPLGEATNKWEDYFQGFVEGNADRIFTSTNIMR